MRRLALLALILVLAAAPASAQMRQQCTEPLHPGVCFTNNTVFPWCIVMYDDNNNVAVGCPIAAHNLSNTLPDGTFTIHWADPNAYIGYCPAEQNPSCFGNPTEGMEGYGHLTAEYSWGDVICKGVVSIFGTVHTLDGSNQYFDLSAYGVDRPSRQVGCETVRLNITVTPVMP